MPWKTFLAAHWDGLATADFFTVEVLTLTGLVRYVVLFVMKLKTRTVEIAGSPLNWTKLDDTGVTLLRLPARSPTLNAFAERFVGSVKSECLARMVPLGEGHLRPYERLSITTMGNGRTRVCATNASCPRPP
jgi:hypothetical protein